MPRAKRGMIRITMYVSKADEERVADLADATQVTKADVHRAALAIGITSLEQKTCSPWRRANGL
jgi:hypothetical protein